VALPPSDILRELEAQTRTYLLIYVTCGFAANQVYYRRSRTVFIVRTVCYEISLCLACVADRVD
jgi:hypothetical protein